VSTGVQQLNQSPASPFALQPPTVSGCPTKSLPISEQSHHAEAPVRDGHARQKGQCLDIDTGNEGFKSGLERR
jgi:hypothetical protein